MALVSEPFSLRGVVTAEGWLAGCQGEPEATVRVRMAAALLARLSGRAPTFDDLTLDGDMALAQSVGRLLGRLRWVPADDLSRVFGDVAAHRIDSLVRSTVGLEDLPGVCWKSWIEYWREETQVLAKKTDVEHLMTVIDTLRDDTERFEKRLLRLEVHAKPQ